MRYHVILTCMIAIITGCDKDAVRQEKGRDFTDLTVYLNEEETELMSKKVSYEKTIFFNGKREKKVPDRFDWRKELKPFYECNLNEISMITDYRCDTLKRGDTTTITYSARGEREKVRKMSIVLYDHGIQRINIRTSISNPWFSLERELYYQKNQGYSIAESRKMALTGRDSLNIRVIFRP